MRFASLLHDLRMSNSHFSPGWKTGIVRNRLNKVFRVKGRFLMPFESRIQFRVLEREHMIPAAAELQVPLQFITAECSGHAERMMSIVVILMNYGNPNRLRQSREPSRDRAL